MVLQTTVHVIRKLSFLNLLMTLFFPSKITLLNNLWGRGVVDCIILKLSPALRIDLSGTLQFLVISTTFLIQHSNSVNFSDCLIAEKKESTSKKKKKKKNWVLHHNFFCLSGFWATKRTATCTWFLIPSWASKSVIRALSVWFSFFSFFCSFLNFFVYFLFI